MLPPERRHVRDNRRRDVDALLLEFDSVSAVVRMMKYITKFEAKVPLPTSSLRSAISWPLAPRLSAIFVRPLDFFSSTSCELCQ